MSRVTTGKSGQSGKRCDQPCAYRSNRAKENHRQCNGSDVSNAELVLSPAYRVGCCGTRDGGEIRRARGADAALAVGHVGGCCKLICRQIRPVGVVGAAGGIGRRITTVEDLEGGGTIRDGLKYLHITGKDAQCHFN